MSNLLVDVHAHLELFSEQELITVIEEAKRAGLHKIITSGSNPDANRKSLSLAKKFDLVDAALGIYPVDASEMDAHQIDNEFEFIEKNIKNIVALGEVGLDYLKTDERKQQEATFQKFIALSEKHNIPLIAHSRRAESTVVELLSSSNAKNVILHSFEGKMTDIKKAADNNFHFSIPSNLDRSKHFQNLIAEVPISSLLTETDAPFLAPKPGDKSQPAFVKDTIIQIAKLKGLDSEEAKKLIFLNYQRMFKKG